MNRGRNTQNSKGRVNQDSVALNPDTQPTQYFKWTDGTALQMEVKALSKTTKESLSTMSKTWKEDIEKCLKTQSEIVVNCNKSKDMIIDKLTGVITNVMKKHEKSKEKINQLIATVERLSSELNAIKGEAKVEHPIAMDQSKIHTPLEILNPSMEATPHEESSERNIIVFGLIPKNAEDDCTQHVGNFLHDTLGLDNKRICRVEVIGKNFKRDFAPVRVSFKSRHDRASVFRNCHKLKGKQVSIQEDLSLEERDIRRAVLPHLKYHKEQGRKVYFRGSSLYVDEKVVLAHALKPFIERERLPDYE